MEDSKLPIIIFVLMIVGVFIPIFGNIFMINQNKNSVKLETTNKKLYKADYVHLYCKGVEGVILPDRTRIDCLTENQAWEFNWAEKWNESFGRVLWHAYRLEKKPCLALILKSSDDYIYLDVAKKLCDKYGVNLIEIKTKDFANN